MNRKQRNSLDNHLPLLVTLPNPQLGEPALIVPGDAGLAGPVGHHLPDGLKDDTRSPVGEVNFPSQLCHLALSAPCHAGKRDCPRAVPRHFMWNETVTTLRACTLGAMTRGRVKACRRPPEGLGLDAAGGHPTLA